MNQTALPPTVTRALNDLPKVRNRSASSSYISMVTSSPSRSSFLQAKWERSSSLPSNKLANSPSPKLLPRDEPAYRTLPPLSQKNPLNQSDNSIISMLMQRQVSLEKRIEDLEKMVRKDSLFSVRSSLYSRASVAEDNYMDDDSVREDHVESYIPVAVSRPESALSQVSRASSINQDTIPSPNGKFQPDEPREFCMEESQEPVTEEIQDEPVQANGDQGMEDIEIAASQADEVQSMTPITTAWKSDNAFPSSLIVEKS